MIRYIDLTNQICFDGRPEFAWYNTVTSKFMSFDYQQTFDSWEEFEECYGQGEHGGYPLERFKKLFPK
jgi:hypothetical protein